MHVGAWDRGPTLIRHGGYRRQSGGDVEGGRDGRAPRRRVYSVSGASPGCVLAGGGGRAGGSAPGSRRGRGGRRADHGQHDPCRKPRSPAATAPRWPVVGAGQGPLRDRRWLRLRRRGVEDGDLRSRCDQLRAQRADRLGLVADRPLLGGDVADQRFQQHPRGFRHVLGAKQAGEEGWKWTVHRRSEMMVP